MTLLRHAPSPPGRATPLFMRTLSLQNHTVYPTRLSYSLATHRDTAGYQTPLHNPLMELLQAVRDGGSISAAAATLGLSYRHVWGELKRWEQRLGRALILWERGQPARLSELGDKLLSAERQSQARLAPQIDSLRAELERGFAMAFDNSTPVLNMHASHDEPLVRLCEHAATHASGGTRLHLNIHFCGSVDAIRSLHEGRCLLAGFHAPPRTPADSHLARAYAPLLHPDRHDIIGFARRTQGLMVPTGNPLALESLADAVRADARFARRPPGSGTRELLADLLDHAGLPQQEFLPCTTTEPCQAAVAQAILTGLADVGLGTEQMARSRGLDFVPLIQEDYYLAYPTSARDFPPISALRELLRSATWRHHLDLTPGYLNLDSDDRLALRQTLPWWKS